MSFLRLIKNYFLANRLRKVIKNWKLDYKVFQNIQIPLEYTTLVDKLKGVSKYESLIQKSKELVVSVQNHNTKIAELKNHFDEILSQHSIQTILSRIDRYSLETLQSYNEIALKIFSYSLPYTFSDSKHYKTYAVQLGKIINEYQQIVEQFSLIKQFNSLSFNFDDKYIDFNEGQKLLEPAKNILSKIRSCASQYYAVPKLDVNIIDCHNEEFIQKHLSDKIFDDVNGLRLDEEQRRAILCDSQSNLTIAGAGAGKTLTICGKVKWLLDKHLVNPNDILLLSYSKDSANALNAKVNGITQNLTVKTFHALGLDILNHVNGSKKAIEQQFRGYIHKFFNEELAKNPQISEVVIRYCTLYMYSNSFDEKRFANDGEKFEELKKIDFQTLKDKFNLAKEQNYETINKEYVKSYQELVIANWLFLNGIKYEYERSYEHDTSTPEKRQYTPDFYLSDYNIYFEHYGIDKNGRTPQYSKEEEKRYLEGISWKRETHFRYHTDCIETYSYEFCDGTIFDKLKKRLENKGVRLQPLNSKDIEKIIYQGQEFEFLINLVETFVNLYKAQYPDSTYFEKLQRSKFGSVYESEREKLFLSICKAVYEYYISILRNEDKIDFDDMILQSIEALDKTKSYRYKYIIVDEFQDISQSRKRFLQKLIEHGNSKLFAVGDDWQAIYRFAGCDINIFLQFQQIFADAKINFITSTHRNSAELQNVVEPFITANPEQFEKHIRSVKHQNSPVRIIYHDKNRIGAFYKALRDIAKINSSAQVLVLGRNRHDIDQMISGGLVVKQYRQIYVEQFPQMDITYMTVHQSKGLESDFVILISGEDAKSGFPNKLEDDPLIGLVLSNSSTFEFAEERRLFYVALTRTRSIVYVLSDRNRPSVFVQEIAENATAENFNFIPVVEKNGNCPWCTSGRLVFRQSTKSKAEFYGCSNWPYCSYTIYNMEAVKINNRCPECGDFLVVRDGKNGKFLGCNGYPRCKYTRNFH
ncbi:MAG: UvrD-helicase domain-containing protein [Corallococcus sp.]|nr:UvrD-helicase domain-containing protein [Corallococcus sp.]MCM1360115.1 UvrD-helicase domain-containing protein [Corallococcus sp.]MCM1395672.1 UvrD-helicase domain-containing protein [Corallococcus sp.]